jgi:hypothetical protein
VNRGSFESLDSGSFGDREAACEASKLAMIRDRSSGVIFSQVRMCLCMLELLPDIASTISKAVDRNRNCQHTLTPWLAVALKIGF